MEQMIISDESYNRLLEAIFPIITSKGLKATTMDNVAASLSMSKRTLYEIFGSKSEMLSAVIRYFHGRHQRLLERIFESSDSVMEAMYRVLLLNKKAMREFSVEFFRDMDSYYKELRDLYESESKGWNENLMTTIRLGVEQGVFREDVNYPITLRMMRIQMESLKRMEEFFPPDVRLQDALDTIIVGFLRSIASQKGMEILDEIRKRDPYKEEQSGYSNKQHSHL